MQVDTIVLFYFLIRLELFSDSIKTENLFSKWEILSIV